MFGSLQLPIADGVPAGRRARDASGAVLSYLLRAIGRRGINNRSGVHERSGLPSTRRVQAMRGWLDVVRSRRLREWQMLHDLPSVSGRRWFRHV